MLQALRYNRHKIEKQTTLLVTAPAAMVLDTAGVIVKVVVEATARAAVAVAVAIVATAEAITAWLA